MTGHDLLAAGPADPASGGIIKLAVLAVGGQGGGVLTGWIEALARANGHVCQATSVAGVAQRTGATVYYVEMAPAGPQTPVFSLMPAAGDVDIMITAEMMEAGRAILRGFVTPDRTVLITSTHRALAVSEKMAPGDGIASSAEVMAAAGIAARRVIAADFEALALRNGSVVSAALFGALAGADVLPFARAAFEAAIKAGGTGVEGSLRAFAAGHDAARAGAAPADKAAPVVRADPRGPGPLLRDWHALAARLAVMPPQVAEMARAGVQKVVEFQDTAYGAAYVDRLEALLAQDRAPFTFAREAAKHLANAMAYDDVIRVADLKTQAERAPRIAREMAARDGNLVQVTEFLHPRAEEIVGMLPAGLGARLRGDAAWMARIDRWFNRGRRLRSDRLGAFVTLYLLAGMKRRRLRSLRHGEEMAHLQDWLARATACLARDYDLAVEVIRCRRLVKGYSDTHARGLSKFDRVMAAVALLEGRADAAPWLARLRAAALQDEEGRALDGALATVRSFL